jgi:DnaK suppressor protein
MTDQNPFSLSDIRNEAYMGARQLEYFENKLKKEKTELLTRLNLNQTDNFNKIVNSYDYLDRAVEESANSSILISNERTINQLRRVCDALDRIKEKSYGYCELTGNEIGIDRLDAEPTATTCIWAQEKKERDAKFKSNTMYSDLNDDDNGFFI